MTDELAKVDIDTTASEGPAAGYVDVMIPRLRSTFEVIAHLLVDGRIDEAVVLLRRQVEDGMRFHYLAENPDRADALVTGFTLGREKKVLSRMDKLLSDSTISDAAKAAIKDARKPRAKQVQLHLKLIKQQEIESEAMPDFDELARKLDRVRDIVVYASASEVAHSAQSGITPAYATVEDDGVVLISTTSDSLLDAVGVARPAVTSTAIAVASALRIRGRDAEADRLLTAAVVIEKAMTKLRDELATDV